MGQEPGREAHSRSVPLPSRGAGPRKEKSHDKFALKDTIRAGKIIGYGPGFGYD
jgi:hypothetical protein